MTHYYGTEYHKYPIDDWRTITESGPWRAEGFYPGAGYVVWWEELAALPKADALSQTGVAWSNFPGQAHKRADELSFQLWADDHAWLANVGYVKYGEAKRSHAVSWASSNPPYPVGASAESARRNELIGYGYSADLGSVELGRVHRSGYRARRQVVAVGSNVWIVIDAVASAESRSRTVWTTGPEVKIRAKDVRDVFIFERGAEEPFAGGVATSREIVPASALIVDQPTTGAGSRVITVWNMREPSKPAELRVTAPPRVTELAGVSRWTMQSHAGSKTLSIRRRGAAMEWHDGESRTNPNPYA